ncbi:hypothetical protein ACONUD_00740 [Microbulbifer harenosus]|uniref:Preprotein translocase subunit SecB n=1 Tax=Microbulbifer harenosus TaxID=2576840 RepID=A0ABY2UMU8_9GAMM|nr:hypothetical protein [Microbulbifer harenosus]TLM79936.1 hypothetical protein FDY93_00735 [Microbulbifer harenosus]
MFKGIRVLKIESNLGEIAYQDNVAFGVELNTRCERGDKYEGQKGVISVFFDLTLEFVRTQGEDREEPEVIGKSQIFSQSLFKDEKLEDETWTDAELDAFAKDSLMVIYPHVYQKMQQVFNIHGAGMPNLPLMVNLAALEEMSQS